MKFRTDLLKNEIIDDVPYYLSKNLKVEIDVNEKIEKFFTYLVKINSDEISLNEKVSLLKNKLQEESDRNLKYLIEYSDLLALKVVVLKSVSMLYTQGYLDKDLYEILNERKNKTVVFFDAGTDIEYSRDISNFIRPSNLSEKTDILLANIIEDKKVKPILVSLIQEVIIPNMVFSEERTAKEKEKVLSTIAPVLKVLEVEKNEIIIEKGKRVTSKHIAQIAQLKSIFRPGTKPTFFFGIILLFLLLGLAGAIYLSLLNREIF